MPRTIVCGVDDSEAAVAVADTARWLANGLQSRLVLVHVAPFGWRPAFVFYGLNTNERARFRVGETDGSSVIRARIVRGEAFERSRR